MNELDALQAVRMKGRMGRDDLPSGVVHGLVASGLVVDGPTVRLSPAGRARLDKLLAIERSTLDHTALVGCYDEFRSVNPELKSLITDWQLRSGQPNDHGDADYDAGILARLDEVHRSVMPIMDAVAVQMPRLARYAEKLAVARDRVRAGDTVWLSRPLIDSYHTVWFELHEELLGAVGLTRDAGDA